MVIGLLQRHGIARCMFDINFNIGFDSIIYNPSSLCENIVVVTEIDVSRC